MRPESFATELSPIKILFNNSIPVVKLGLHNAAQMLLKLNNLKLHRRRILQISQNFALEEML